MKKRRFLSGLTALSVTAGMLGVMPALVSDTYAAEIVKNDFEINYDGWCSDNNETTLTAVDGAGFNGSRGLILSDRTDSSDGVSSSKGFYLWGGVEYDYGVKVKSDTAEHFTLTLTYTLGQDDDAKDTTVTLDDQYVPAGQWATLGGTFKAPKDAYEFRLDITTDSTNAFTIDDLLITTEQDRNTANAAPAGKGLKDEFANYFLCGNILNSGTVQNSAICANLIKDCNVIECENETKPDATIVQSGSTDTNVKVAFGNGAASIIDFCIRNNIGFRGHTLVWHSQTKEWFFKTGFSDNGSYVSSSVMDQRMESYIKNMFDAYATQYPTLNLVAYDVCNEVIYDGTAKNGGLRPTQGDGRSAWVQVYGNNSFVEKAFTYARRYAPKTCKLFYNDYNEFAYDKQNCIIDTILTPLHNKGLLDGMGMQSHLNCAASNAWGDTNSYLAAMDKYLALGIEVQVTELDLSRDGGTYSDSQQADKYKAIFKHCVDVNSSGQFPGRVTLVQVWGPNDNNSWVGKDRNGNPNYPLLYDGNNQPKSAYNAVTSIISDDQWGDGSNPGSFEIKPVEPDERGYYFEHSFEGTDNNWESRGGTSIMTSGRTAYDGAESLLVSERTSSWNGAQLSLSPNPFKPGETFSFSTNVMAFDGAETTEFKFTLQYTGSDGEPHYSEIARASGIKGQWVQLANTEYTIPEDATSMLIYVETSDDTTNNFYIDDVVGAVAGTVVPGAGQPKIRTMIPGDIDGDERVTVFDVIAGRDGYVNGFTDTIAAKCADADQSGKYEMNDLVLIQQFVLKKITEFPIAEPEYDVVDEGKMQSLFSSVTAASSWKKDGENNPLTTQRFGADPGWMVYDGRLYLYTTNDAFEHDNQGRLRENTYYSGTINCISTADMVNWTDHGAIPVAGKETSNGPAKWANRAWAPDALWKTDPKTGKDKFYLYFANSGGGIGVLTADSPTGPWSDPIGGPLLDWSTPGNSGVVWMFDPGVYYDPDTGKGYIAFGGGVDGKDKSNPKTGRIAELGDDMISIKGSTVTMETPYLFEDSSLIKIGDTWYYSYCTNWDVPWNNTTNGVSFGSGEICYMTSKNPLGSWTSANLAGKVLPGTGAVDNGGNNHHSIIYFKDKYYVAYHTRQQAIRMTAELGYKYYNSKGELTNSKDGNYRSTHINEASYNPSTGKITCNIDMKGVSQIETLDPFTKVQAETMSNQSKGISVNGLYDTTVTGKKGDWIKVSGADLKTGIKGITVKGSGGSVKICTGSPTGTVLGYAELGSTSQEVTFAATGNATGNKDIYIVFGNDNITLDYWNFV